MLYLYIYIHNDYCTVNNFILLSNNNIINYCKCVYIVCIVCNLWLFYIIIVIVPFESSITCEMLYTVTEHKSDYYEHNVQK